MVIVVVEREKSDERRERLIWFVKVVFGSSGSSENGGREEQWAQKANQFSVNAVDERKERREKYSEGGQVFMLEIGASGR